MKAFKTLVAATLIAVAGAASAAATSPDSDDGTFGPLWSNTDYFRGHVAEYRDRLEKMTPEERSKMMAMQDRIMKMEMDFRSQVTKMQTDHAMEMAKARRELDLFMLGIGH